MKTLFSKKKRKKKSLHLYLLFVLLAQIALPSASFASGYTENLFLCDMGIMNPDRSNTRGVDYVEYLQNERSNMIHGSYAWSTAIDIAKTKIQNYERWNPAFGINDVSFNLDSEFYGTEYYLEYCYTWDRVLPLDPILYTLTFTSELPIEIPHTQFETSSTCSIKSEDGHSTENTKYPQTPEIEIMLNPDQVSMRCTIRLSFKELTGNIYRPHNQDLGAIDPKVQIKVEP